MSDENIFELIKLKKRPEIPAFQFFKNADIKIKQ